MKMLISFFLFSIFASTTMSCADTMTFQRPTKTKDAVGLPRLCIRIPAESLEYRAPIIYETLRESILIGPALPAIVEYEAKEYFDTVTIVTNKEDPSFDTTTCPPGTSSLDVHIVSITTDVHHSPIGFGSVSASAVLRLRLQTIEGVSIVSSYSSPQVKAPWPWFTMPTYALARSAIPGALRLGMRSNIKYIASCQAGRCISADDIKEPSTVWAQDIR